VLQATIRLQIPHPTGLLMSANIEIKARMQNGNKL
jgi:hypothetical protein